MKQIGTWGKQDEKISLSHGIITLSTEIRSSAKHIPQMEQPATSPAPAQLVSSCEPANFKPDLFSLRNEKEPLEK